MDKKEKLFVIVESQLINGEGKTELEISHLAINLAKKPVWARVINGYQT